MQKTTIIACAALLAIAASIALYVHSGRVFLECGYDCPIFGSGGGPAAIAGEIYAIGITIIALITLTVCGFLWWRQYRQFVWRTGDIAASIRQHDPAFYTGRYLNLDQTLREGESGWVNSKIDIPESWDVRSIEMDSSRIVLTLADGRRYALGRRNVGRLSSDILSGGVNKADEELQRIWDRYARLRQLAIR